MEIRRTKTTILQHSTDRFIYKHKAIDKSHGKMMFPIQGYSKNKKHNRSHNRRSHKRYSASQDLSQNSIALIHTLYFTKGEKQNMATENELLKACVERERVQFII